MQCRWAAACEFFLSLFPPFPPVQDEHPYCRKACVAISDYEEEPSDDEEPAYFYDPA